jgi:hypothetical protein
VLCLQLGLGLRLGLGLWCYGCYGWRWD